MNKMQYFAERKKIPPVLTRIITGDMAMVLHTAAGNTTLFGAHEVPEGWWASQCRSKTS